MATSKMFALNAMEKLFKKAGAERVSPDAQKALKEVIEERGMKIASDAAKLASHAGRKTVKSSDVRLAARAMG